MNRDQFLTLKLSGVKTAPNVVIWNNAVFDVGEDVIEEKQRSASTSSSCLSHFVDSHSRHEDDPVKRLEREIEAIETEIARLRSRLNVLKLEKAEAKLKKIGGAIKTEMGDKNVRGIETVTPVSKMSRRVSCFWRLQEMDELKVMKERRKSSSPSLSLSLSPKSRKPWPKAETKGVAEERIQRGKHERVVPSSYNNGDMRKRALPDGAHPEALKRRLPWGTSAIVNTPPFDFMPPIKVSRRLTQTPKDTR